MTLPLNTVCVVGAGLAGLASAIAAAGRNIRVDVFDAAPAPPVLQAHLEVVPNMLRELVMLGVADECVKAGFAYHGIDVLDRHGVEQFRLPTERLSGTRYPSALGIESGELHRLLVRSASARGVRLHWACEVSQVQRRGEFAVTCLSSGHEIASDLVILASGSASPLRAALFPGAQPTVDIGQVWWHALVQRPVELDRPCWIVGSQRRKVLLVPVRDDVAGLAMFEPLQQAAPSVSGSKAAHFHRALATFPALVRAAARHVLADTQIALHSPRSGLLRPPWHCDHVLAVGSCAHAMPPHFGQSAAQAIEDAAVFADLLANARDRSGLVEGFTQRRLERVRQVHEITTMAARWNLEPDRTTDMRELMARLDRTVSVAA